MGAQVHFKCSNTIKDMLVAPKDKDRVTNKGSIIYRYKCCHPECIVEYISDTGRTFVDRYKECLRALCHIHDHANTRGYSIQLDSFFHSRKGVPGNHKDHKRGNVYQNQWPSPNSNLGMYQLPQIWDMYCRKCWLPVYSNTPIFSTFPSQFHLGHPTPREHMHINLVSMVLPGVSLPPTTSILAPNYPSNSGTKIAKYNIFHQTRRGILVGTSQKLVYLQNMKSVLLNYWSKLIITQ